MIYKNSAVMGIKSKYYHGWNVVVVAAVVATFGWGLGFYGPAVYLVALQERHGWSAGQISPAITFYYLLAALLIVLSARAFEGLGVRRVVACGHLAMAIGVLALACLQQQWQTYIAFAVMAAGWAVMSGAAINIIVAPWFDKRRGLAVSLALTGSGFGGMIVVPALLTVSGLFGFTAAIAVVVAAMLLISLPLVLLTLRPKRADEHDVADQPETAATRTTPTAADAATWRIAAALRDVRFLTISIPFALGLMAQVGFLTHQIAFLSPLIGTAGSGTAVAIMVVSSMLWRVCTGSFVDKLDARLFACGNFLLQALAMAAFVGAGSAAGLYLASFLLGLSIGNMIALPGIVLQREFPREHFARAISLVVGINQFVFAFGPTLVSVLRRADGSYGQALLVCAAIQVTAAVVIMLPATVGTRLRHRAG